jgi:hypothetical protein
MIGQEFKPVALVLQMGDFAFELRDLALEFLSDSAACCIHAHNSS